MNREDAINRIKKISPNEEPENPKFSVNYMDKNVDPLDNFYEYSNGNWIRTHPIPEDKAHWGASSELDERNIYILGKILEKCSLNNTQGEGRMEQQLGDFYISSMDTEKIEELKFRPLKEIAEKIDNMRSSEDLISVTEELHSIGVKTLFGYESESDEKNSTVYAFYANQSGLSLPNRDYYLEERFQDIRKDFLKHVEKMFSLYGYEEKDARETSVLILEMETAMARSSRKPVELRDPEKNYNRIEMKDLENTFGSLNMKEYFIRSKMAGSDYIIVGQPEFFKNLNVMLERYDLSQWKAYMKWKLIHSYAPYLHQEVEDEDFDFFHRKLFGQREKEKRWKTVVRIIDQLMGEALGKLYVDQEFGEDSKKRMDDMIEDLKEVFRKRIMNLTWMSDDTKKKALEKFNRFRAKVGYPSKFIDYSSIEIFFEDFIGNIMRCNNFEYRRAMDRVGLPVDKELWFMSPPTVNAYFSPTDNEIVFPAGILQPPFFDPELDDAVNYGATGGTIAHEISHGFDDLGRKFDLEGNLNEWWTPEDDRTFMEKAKEVVELYNVLEALPGLKVNGELTLGENIADLGGVSIAFEALQRRIQRHPEMNKVIDGLTPEQRFFIGWAQGWRMNLRDEALIWQVSNDPHSPNNFRAEIPARVHDKFEEVFSNLTTKKDKKFKKIKIW